MLKPDDQHLTDAELDELIGPKAERAPLGSAGESSSDEAVRHLSDCRECRYRFENLAAADAKLQTLQKLSEKNLRADCPSHDEWARLAAGLADHNRTEGLLNHAAGCDLCGPLLRALMEDFAESGSPEEAAILSGLDSAQPEWQKRVAARLGSGSSSLAVAIPREVKTGRSSFAAWRWAVVTGICLAMFAISTWLFLPRPESHVQHLIGEAYAERRSTELRIPGAGYGPIRMERGQHPSRLDRTPALLEAETLIAKRLAKDPSDSFWLQSRGRTELLEGDYASAIETLQRALTGNPKSSSLLADLGTAFFQRAVTLDRPADLGQAMDLLGRSLSLNPHDPTALFNRAIVAERLFLYTQALEDWREYLELDPQGPWADEARERMKRVQDQLRKQSQDRGKPLLGASEISLAIAQGVRARRLIDDRIEEYYHTATTDWLPDAFGSSKLLSIEDRQLRKSTLSVLAEVSDSQHNDRWLSALLSETGSASFPIALNLLAEAKRENDAGNFGSALAHSTKAKKQFRLAHNEPGELRAALEEVYALRLLQEGVTCARATDYLVPRLNQSKYTWLTAQAQMERAICYDIIGDHRRALASAKEAVRLTENFGYDGSCLRALLVASVLSTPSTESSSKWTADLSGLRRYWSGAFPRMRGYSFYTDLDALAEKADEPYLEIAILQQAIATLGSDPDIVLRAMVHSKLAAAALQANMPTLSSAEYRQASELFSQAPDSKAARSGQVETKTWLARIEMLQHEFADANQQLSSIQTSLPKVSNQYVAINFYQTLAEVRLRGGELNLAAKPARAAVALAEHGLLTLKSDTDRMLWRRETASSYKTLIESSLQGGDKIGSLELWEWYRGAYLRNGPALLRTGKLTEIASQYQTLEFSKLLDPPPLPALDVVSRGITLLSDQLVISYAVFPHGIELWDFDDRGINSSWISIEESRLTQIVHEYLALCANPHSDTATLSLKSRQLYQLLVAPIAQRFSPERTLVIEPDGVLASLPFGSLRNTSDQYLADVMSIAVSPGMYYSLATSRPSDFSVDSAILVVGSPATGTSSNNVDLPFLPDAALEAQSVALKFRRPRVFLGALATSRVVQRELATAQIFHFAGHAVSTAGDIALVLAPGPADQPTVENLGAADLKATNFQKLRLVVLSACGTQKSSAEFSADPSNLAFVFLRAGVPHVIATRWDVDSASARLLTDCFYDELLLGKSVPEALRNASMKLRKEAGKDHPYYWATFESFGRS